MRASLSDSCGNQMPALKPYYASHYYEPTPDDKTAELVHLLRSRTVDNLQSQFAELGHVRALLDEHGERPLEYDMRTGNHVYGSDTVHWLAEHLLDHLLQNGV